MSMKIREAHPLKQGLKPCYLSMTISTNNNSRGTSTKTRIETYGIWLDMFKILHSRGTSTKTRIETKDNLLMVSM